MLGWYWHNTLDSLNNKSDFNKKEENDKRKEFEEDKPIALLFLPASRLAELS